MSEEAFPKGFQNMLEQISGIAKKTYSMNRYFQGQDVAQSVPNSQNGHQQQITIKEQEKKETQGKRAQEKVQEEKIMQVPSQPIKIEQKRQRSKAAGSSGNRQTSRKKTTVELKYCFKKMKILKNIMRKDQYNKIATHIRDEVESAWVRYANTNEHHQYQRFCLANKSKEKMSRLLSRSKSKSKTRNHNGFNSPYGGMQTSQAHHHTKSNNKSKSSFRSHDKKMIKSNLRLKNPVYTKAENIKSVSIKKKAKQTGQSKIKQ